MKSMTAGSQHTPGYCAAVAALFLAAALSACAPHAPPAYQGYVEGEFLYIGADSAGRLARLSVVRGQQVRAHDPLFALNDVEQSAARRQAQRQLDAARAALADMRTGKRLPEIGVIRAQLLQAQAAARSSAAAIVRDRAQYLAGGMSQAQLDAARALAASDAARVQELRSQIRAAQLPGRRGRILAQSAEVSVAAAALDQANWHLEQRSVRAPAAGLIYDTIYRPGEFVAAGSPIVRMLPPQNIKLRFFVPESMIGSVSVGKRALVRCDTCGAPIDARVDYVAAEAEYTPPVIYSDESRTKLVYLVEARPAPADATRLHPGEPVQVQLQ